MRAVVARRRLWINNECDTHDCCVGEETRKRHRLVWIFQVLNLKTNLKHLKLFPARLQLGGLKAVYFRAAWVETGVHTCKKATLAGDFNVKGLFLRRGCSRVVWPELGWTAGLSTSHSFSWAEMLTDWFSFIKPVALTNSFCSA